MKLASIFKKLSIAFVGLAGVALLAGATFEQIGRINARRDYPPPGRMIDIGGRRIQLDCRGKGSPTVVFESGLGTTGSLDWWRVHDQIAATTRACVYSRAGMMWSDPAPGPRDGNAMAEDLHKTLSMSGEAFPIVLVAQSAGGLIAMIYTRRFPTEVVGLVMVDTSNPDQDRIVRAIRGQSGGAPPMLLNRLEQVLGWTGGYRLYSLLFTREETDYPPDQRSAYHAYSPTSFFEWVNEEAAWDATLAEADGPHEWGNRPVYVMTGGVWPTDPSLTPEVANALRRAWRSMHDEQASWSTVSHHEVIPDGLHVLQLQKPDAVVKGVLWVVDKLKAGKPADQSPAVPGESH
jgi:pimeloyl-ACP methyl ester carboxylesterase